MATVVTQQIPIHGVPSYNRVEPGSVNLAIPDLSSIQVVKPENFEQASEEWVDSFNKAISSSNFKAFDDLFLPQAYWRDHFCLSWDFHTFQGPAKMREFLSAGCRLKSVAIDRSTAFRSPTITGFDGQGKIEGESS